MEGWQKKIYKSRWPKYLKSETVEEFFERDGKINDCTPPKQVVTDGQIKEFYTTPEWKKLRKETYAKLTHFCPVCGSEENLVVDHKKPVRHSWEERLNPNNLQILCNECNLEKGSMIDWTLEWHQKNKEQLQRKRLIENIKRRERKECKEVQKEYYTLCDYEKDCIERSWASYLSKMQQSVNRVTKKEFIVYIRCHLMDLSGAKEYVRKNYSIIKPL